MPISDLDKDVAALLEGDGTASEVPDYLQGYMKDYADGSNGGGRGSTYQPPEYESAYDRISKQYKEAWEEETNIYGLSKWKEFEEKYNIRSLENWNESEVEWDAVQEFNRQSENASRQEDAKALVDKVRTEQTEEWKKLNDDLLYELNKNSSGGEIINEAMDPYSEVPVVVEEDSQIRERMRENRMRDAADRAALEIFNEIGFENEGSSFSEKESQLNDERVQDEIAKQISDTLNNRPSGTQEYLVKGAVLQCSYGSYTRRLDMIESHGVYFGEDKPVAYKDDYMPQKNVMCFGLCKSPKPPAIIESLQKYTPVDSEGNNQSDKVEGVESGRVCIPNICDPGWQDTFEKTGISPAPIPIPIDGASVNAFNILNRRSYLICTHGGVILPLTGGQKELSIQPLPFADCPYPLGSDAFYAYCMDKGICPFIPGSDQYFNWYDNKWDGLHEAYQNPSASKDQKNNTRGEMDKLYSQWYQDMSIYDPEILLSENEWDQSRTKIRDQYREIVPLDGAKGAEDELYEWKTRYGFNDQSPNNSDVCGELTGSSDYFDWYEKALREGNENLKQQQEDYNSERAMGTGYVPNNEALNLMHQMNQHKEEMKQLKENLKKDLEENGIYFNEEQKAHFISMIEEFDSNYPD